MVTISDVAHAAGVSKATVSYVLSGDPRITQATTLKVQHASDELGYTVNHAARALSVRKTKTIGVVSPDRCIRLAKELTRFGYSGFRFRQGCIINLEFLSL